MRSLDLTIHRVFGLEGANMDFVNRARARDEKIARMKRHAIGHHFTREIPGKRGGGAAVGRIHVFFRIPFMLARICSKASARIISRTGMRTELRC